MRQCDEIYLLDRDGTIIVDKHYLSDPEGVELFPNTAQGLKAMQDAGYKLLVTTNQSGIGRGYYSETDMHAVNERMAELLAEYGIEFKAVYFCLMHRIRPATAVNPLPACLIKP